MSQLQVTGEVKIRDIQGPVVANDGVITALDGAANQYVRGDGTLAIFPTSSGGGSSVSYYLNGSVNQGTFGGSTYYQMSKNAITGVGTNFSASANGLIAQFITDANDPDVVSIPSGNWNVEFFMNVSASSGALASFYVEIYKYDGSTFTLLATNVATPEQLTNTTTVDAYFTSVAMPLSSMAITDRLAIRIFVNVASKTVTLYTENNRLCQVITTFSNGLTSLNNLTDQSQYLTTGTSGTNFNIASSGDTHTFNLPVASATNTGKLSSTDWSTFNNKVPYTGATANVDLGTYDLSAKYLNANGSAGLGGVLNIKQDATYLAKGNGYSSIASTSVLFDFFGYTGASTYKNFSLRFDSLTNNTQRTYTLPDLSGTLALLEGTQTFTGDKLFNGSVDFNNSVNINSGLFIRNNVIGSTLYTNFTITKASSTQTLSYLFSTGFASRLLFNDAATYSYTFPAASGTIALTSNLSSYVPYTGATTNVNLGTNFLYAGYVEIVSSTSTYLGLKSTAASGNWWSFVSASNGSLFIGINGASNAITISPSNKVDFGSTIGNGTFTYTLPSATGTLALTSQIPSLANYVTLDGTQTITGDKTFTSDLKSAMISIANSNTLYTRTGYTTLSASSISTTGWIAFSWGNTNSATLAFNNAAQYTYTFPASSGTIALTSNLSAYLPLTGGTLTGALSGTSATFSSSVTATSLNIKDLSSDNPSTLALFEGAQSGRGLQIGLTTDSLGATGSAVIYNARVGGGYGGHIWQNGGSTRMILNASGNVGIGTSSPTTYGLAGTHLDVSGGANYSFIHCNTTTVKSFLACNESALLTALFTFSNHPLTFGTNNTERMRITSGGNVCIGVTTAAEQFYVKALTSNNVARFQVDTNGNGIIFANASNSVVGSITIGAATTSYNVTSDYRLKQDFKDYNGLSLVSKIKTYDYEWKSDKSRMFGVVAHELAEILPYAVTGEKDGEMMQGVDYSKLVPVLVKAIQEQQAQIELLSNKIVALESK